MAYISTPSSFLDKISTKSADASVTELREMIRCDLEDLLNTMQGRDDVPAWFSNLNKSLAAYGLHGFNSANLEDRQERRNLISAIKSAIVQFEPRLHSVMVVDQGVLHPFVLRFTIEAVIKFDTYTDHLSFGTAIRKHGFASVV